ncbi:transglutaminase family protein [Aerophototrophica crusticola]|uniref:Transglutaminase family protein n=2 Tax=Aerophototrophica crusticola TaxID=1709002 RepID=A0A858RD20_9PROT|nr:transglutaminase family protein [Rhodospirillaceae bacterium B3]
MVLSSHLVAHLAPRPHPRQDAKVLRLEIEPRPAFAVDRRDWFGNPTTVAGIQEPHRTLSVMAEMEVEVSPPPPLDPFATPAWEQVRAAAPADPALVEFTLASPRVPAPDPALAAFATPSFPPGRPVAAGAMDLMRRIRDGFTFDATATTVSTPVAEVLARRSGVCQDFAHLMIGALRSLGLPARYVSGYLRTIPPPGRPRLVGADASHAWVQAWCGDAVEWLDLDPTNGKLGDTDHLTLAWGRDYDDVCPLRGVIVGGGSHTLTVSVDVEQLQGG